MYAYNYDTTTTTKQNHWLYTRSQRKHKDLMKHADEFPTCTDYTEPYVGCWVTTSANHFDLGEQTCPMKPSEHTLSTLNSIESLDSA